MIPYDAEPVRRAYSLRLTGADSNDNAWRDALWQTHLTVNHGAKIFGDWLLTFRGGIPASKVFHDSLSKDQLVHRQIILTLSWLSVEDLEGSPQDYRLDLAKDNSILEKTLRHILLDQGLSDSEIETWVDNCKFAKIRDDATWVNRYQCFKDKQVQIPISVEDIEDFLLHFFGSWKAYFEPVDQNESEGSKDLIIKAGHWLSGRFGSGKGASYELFARIYSEILAWSIVDIPDKLSGLEVIESLTRHLNAQQILVKDLKELLAQLSGPGYKSGTKILLEQILKKQYVSDDDIQLLAEKAKKDYNSATSKIGKKGSRPYSQEILAVVEKEIGLTYSPTDAASSHKEFSVMLDHAARRVSQTHTWIKRAEAERKKFEASIQAMQAVPEEAKKWLNQYRKDRAENSGSLQEYIITRGAISDWSAILKLWQECDDTKSRIDATRTLQKEGSIEKFGDVNLFEALAIEEARCVWEKDGKYNASILTNYVNATVAENDRQRFKVPAYRHPHELKHPIFAEFGNSRWSVRYAVHREVLSQSKTRKTTNAKSFDLQGLTMSLWDGKRLAPFSLRWQGKRFSNEVLGKDFNPAVALNDQVLGVPRQTRFGRAAIGLDASSEQSRILQVFEEKDWNARLQVDREILHRLAQLKENNKCEQFDRTVAQLPWFISLTASLQPTGVWERYVHELDSQSRQAFLRENNGQLLFSAKGWPHQRINLKRHTSSQLILSRLPNLRILSVDLGLRHAAACAVWETLSTEDMERYCSEYNVPHPQDNELFCIIPINKKKKLFFRRIAGNILLDGQQHPAPWAKLERQFLIKLQGEEKASRKPSQAERDWYSDLYQSLGFLEDPSSKKRISHISILHQEAVRTVKTALKRQGRLASLTYSIGNPLQMLPGGQEKNLNSEEWENQIAEALVDFSSHRNQSSAKLLWDSHIQPLLPADLIHETFSNNEEYENVRGEQRKKQIEKLKPVANLLIKNEALRNNLVMELKKLWAIQKTKVLLSLKSLRREILPQGGQAKKVDRSIRYVGGLSLDRVVTITELKRLNDAFNKLGTPDNPKANIVEKGGRYKAHFSEEKALLTLEKLRENRCKQLASRIIEAAMGLGSIKGQTGKRLSTPQYSPCHAVVIERLDNYRPDELRTRRENRQLMEWSAKKTKDYLQQGCELYSLHLRTIHPSFTSRQDSRTGVGGKRCNDYSPERFLGLTDWSRWPKEVLKLSKLSPSKITPTQQWVSDIWRCWNPKTQIWTDFGRQAWQWDNQNYKWNPLTGQTKQPNPIRIPVDGGEIFVTAAENSTIDGGIHADLNAAANIGLKALLDPDWAGTHWKLAVNVQSGLPEITKFEESLIASLSESIIPTETLETLYLKKLKNAKSRELDKVNLFCNPSVKPLESNTRQWKTYREYYEWIELSVVEKLRKQAKVQS